MAMRICSACGEDDVKEGYSCRQWARTNSKCNDCIHGLAGAPPNDNGVEPTRECRECHEVQPKSAYSNTQWKKGERRRCKTCVDDSLAADAVNDVTDFMGKTLTLKAKTLPSSPIPVNVTGGAHHPFKVTSNNDEESVAESNAESVAESVAESDVDAGVESVAESVADSADESSEESDVESANDAEALEESVVESAESSEESDVESVDSPNDAESSEESDVESANDAEALEESAVESEESVVESAESSEESGMESADSPSDSDSSFENSSGESDSDAEGRSAKRSRQRYALRASDASNIAPMPPRARRSNAKRTRGS